MTIRTRILVALSLAIAAAAASAQTVWRCGSSYGTKPCAGGTQVEVADPKSAAEAAQARKAVADEAKRADAMEKARLANEKNAPKVIVIGAREAPKEQPEAAHAKDAKKKKKKAGGHEPADFTASAPKKK